MRVVVGLGGRAAAPVRVCKNLSGEFLGPYEDAVTNCMALLLRGGHSLGPMR